MLFKIGFLKFRNFHRKTPVLESLFNKVVGLQDCNFIEKRSRHICFPVKIAKYLRTSFLQNISGGRFCKVRGFLHSRNPSKTSVTCIGLLQKVILEIQLNFLLTHSFPMHPFSKPLKHQKTVKFFDVFRGQRKGALGTNGLTKVPGLQSSGCNATKKKPLRKFLKGVLKTEKWKILENVQDVLCNSDSDSDSDSESVSFPFFLM